jgi:hypothetical protein
MIKALAKELVPELEEAVGELFTLQGESGNAAGVIQPEIGLEELVELHAQGSFAELADEKDQTGEAELSVPGKIGVGASQHTEHVKIGTAAMKEEFKFADDLYIYLEHGLPLMLLGMSDTSKIHLTATLFYLCSLT